MRLQFSHLLISALAALALYFNTEGADNYSIAGVFLFTYCLLEFIRQLGKSMPLELQMLIIAGAQWVLAPVLSYHFYTESEFYSMVVDEETYMGYVVPALAAFAAGLLSSVRYGDFSRELQAGTKRSYFIVVGRYLFAAGLISYLLRPLIPAALSYVFHLVNNFVVIGAVYMFLGRVRYRYFWLGASFLPFVISAGASSIFHDMLLWGGFLFMLYAFINRISFVRKLVLIACGVFAVIFIQLIKKDYRSAIQEDTGTGKVEIAFEIAAEKSGQVDEGFWQEFVDRLNQGWIIARIMSKVPDDEPFAMGETFIDGFKASLVPRFLDPEKARSGGLYFQRFTGIALRGASMNLGIVGEAYANFGKWGGVFFMFCYGLFFSFVLAFIKRKAKYRPELMLWLPFVFFYVVKAEDDFTTAFNQFVKSALVLVAVFWLLKRTFPRSTVTANQPAT